MRRVGPGPRARRPGLAGSRASRSTSRRRPAPARPRAGSPILAFACLGTSGAVPGVRRDTTALVVRAAETLCLIDVGGSPVQKLGRLGVDPTGLTAVVVTHTHPDHVYGLPALVQCLAILGRRAPLPLYCRIEHVALLHDLLGLFRLGRASDGLEVPVIGIEPREEAPVFVAGELVVSASPNAHGPMPNLAVRLAVGARSLVYSSDTRPCPAVAALARGATVLVHEATLARPTPTQWHSTAREAGEIARAAGVGRLLLAHVGYEQHQALTTVLADARRAFGGSVTVAEELRWYRV